MESSWKSFMQALFFSFIVLSRLGSIQISLSFLYFFHLFSAASYNFSFLADSRLEICRSSCSNPSCAMVLLSTGTWRSGVNTRMESCWHPTEPHRRNLAEKFSGHSAGCAGSILQTGKAGRPSGSRAIPWLPLLTIRLCLGLGHPQF